MNRVQSGTAPPPGGKGKAKDWQLEILMEKLRSKAAQYKTLPEISKNVRMNLLEKRYALDSVEKSQHQKCLDTLQHSIKVTSLQSMVERLESLTRQLGLKFVVEPAGVFISSDMFYLEIVLEPTGAVKDVKIHHEGKQEQQSCTELVNCLSKGDFADFTAQLEGFASIYQLNAEKKVKCKAFTALESLEADLSTLAQLQMFMKEPFNLIHKSPVGILEKRKGGHPMKLTYFVSPYDLINVEKNDLDPINIETILSKGLGYSVTVCMEGSAAHKLQTTTLITINRSINGKGTPSYTSLSNQNSAVIPACFVLKLNKPMPMCLSLVRQIQQLQQWSDIDNVPQQPLLNLIVTHCSEGKVHSANNKGMFVNLPDQNHCYFMTENKNMDGVLVTSIPFTHPAHVANILSILREQALFNIIISSCVRPNSKQDFDNITMFEISALSSKHISVSLEHPIEESMATAEIDLTDISNLVCRVSDPSGAPDSASELATRVLNRSFSLPVTMRAILKMWERQSVGRTNHFSGHENFSLPLGSGDPGGHKDSTGNNLAEFGGLNDKIKQEPSSNGGHTMMMQANQGMFLNESIMASNFQNFPPSDGVLTNIELANILSDTPENIPSASKGKRKVGSEDAEPMDSNDSTQSMLQDAAEATEESNSMDKLDEDDDADEDEEIAEIGLFSGDLTEKQRKSQSRSPSVDLSEKSSPLVAPSTVSITPISSSNPSAGGSSTFSVSTTKDKRDAAPAVPSSVTITAITTTQAKSTSSSSEEKSKEKKSSKSSKEDKNKLEKKRKRKREESPMGPPEKVPHKDPLSKPSTISVKAASESPPIGGTSTPTSPSMMRKFNSSPTSNRSVSSVSGKLSPSLMKSGSKSGSSSSHQSPKHSPAHVPSSPKHSLAGISSPKHHGASPKHPSASGSGKPSMSTLKSAANSPSSGKSSGSGGESKSSKSGSKEGSGGGSSGSSSGSRDKDKKASSVFGVSNSKNKSASLKVKPLEGGSSGSGGGAEAPSSGTPDSLPSPSSGGNSADAKSSANQARNRKGSLSAIVDKLKVNAQHCDMATDLSSKSSTGGGSTGSGGSTSSSSNSANRTSGGGTSGGGATTKTASGGGDSKSGGKTGDVKNSEYMVKPSSDGMKITINKTRTKESSSSSSGAKSSGSSGVNKGSIGTGSPKTHTGLKPGVNAGPASKKTQQLHKSGTSISNSATGYAGSGGGNSSSGNTAGSGNSGGTGNSGGSTGGTKMSSSSLSSGSSLSKSASKFGGSPKTSSSATDLSRSSKDRLKPTKSNSEKSIFSSMKDRKSSPTPSRDDVDSIYRLSQASLMEGMMKTLDKNFQIPKLSARVSEEKKKNEMNNINRSTVDTKFFDTMSKNDLSIPKYPMAISTNKPYENSVDQKMRNSMNSMNPMNLGNKMIDDEDKKKDMPQNLSSSQGKDLDLLKSTYPEPLSLSTKSVDLTSKFAAAAAVTTPLSKPGDDSSTASGGAALDYTKASSGQSAAVGASVVPPSVSVHIVKSPGGRPGGHSAPSPCITDDELMDEAVVGIGK
ncbi:unnamed protein product [Acanthoscelides obtectus]|uniref:Mediator of RNA polymerase II transcription subunit 1 n=1 Tax=Acanthoscelides obtectus TaxID=200917 RepID=A0A9P0P7F4_ACAOB|nr:unnamed protein product [Acanthoscelides obtectus]CAK1664215.1 Mediator of RNA polymerase II transcription subunit 1 [Acanthoscelides obtectus]